jgi:hypothetical protein
MIGGLGNKSFSFTTEGVYFEWPLKAMRLKQHWKFSAVILGFPNQVSLISTLQALVLKTSAESFS